MLLLSLFQAGNPPPRVQRSSSTAGIFDLDSDLPEGLLDGSTAPTPTLPPRLDSSSTLDGDRYSAFSRNNSSPSPFTDPFGETLSQSQRRNSRDQLSSTPSPPHSGNASRSSSPTLYSQSHHRTGSRTGFSSSRLPPISTATHALLSGPTTSTTTSSGIGIGVGVGGVSSLASTSSSQMPSTLSVPHSQVGPLSISPVGKHHSRAPFDTTPSFSSPLAYASTLPSGEEVTDELDLDAQEGETSVVLKDESDSAKADKGKGKADEAREGMEERARSSSGGSASSSKLERRLSHKSAAKAAAGGLQRVVTSSSRHSSATSISVPEATAEEDASSSFSDGGNSQTTGATSASNEPKSRPATRHSSASSTASLMGPPTMLPKKSQAGSRSASASSGSGMSSKSPKEEGSTTFGKGAPSEGSGKEKPPHRRASGSLLGSGSKRRDENALALGLGMPGQYSNSNSKPTSAANSNASNAGSSPSTSPQATHASAVSPPPPSSWDPRQMAGASAASTLASAGSPGTAVTPSGSAKISGSGNRRRRASAAPTSNAHRRARSLGGALLGEGASPIGGPDGVDPGLIAAIHRAGAGDSSIPGTPIADSSSSHHHASTPATRGASHAPAGDSHSSSPSAYGMMAACMGIGNQSTPSHHHTSSTTSGGAASNTSSSPNAPMSLPSTPSGSLNSRKLGKKRSELLNVLPDTRALANTYPSMTIPTSRAAGSGSASSRNSGETSSPNQSWSATEGCDQMGNSPNQSPSSLVPGSLPSSNSSVLPPGYVRSRVRSQTINVSSSPTHSNASLSSSIGPGSSRPGMPLADAIRLQKMPTAVRLAGDLYVPPSPSNHFPGSRQSVGGEPQAYGLGFTTNRELHSRSPQNYGSASTSPQAGFGIGGHSSAGSNASSSGTRGLGLGVGLSPSAGAGSLNLPPSTPSTTRSHSPLPPDGLGLSGRNSPVVSSAAAGSGQWSIKRGLTNSSSAGSGMSIQSAPLSVKIPPLDPNSTASNSAGPVIGGSYSASHSPTTRRPELPPQSLHRRGGSGSGSGSGGSAFSPLLSISPNNSANPLRRIPSVSRSSFGVGQRRDMVWEENETWTPGE